MGYLAAAMVAVVYGFATIPVKMARYPGQVGIVAGVVTATVALGAILAATGGLYVPAASWEDWIYIGLLGTLRFSVAIGLYFAAVKHAGVTVAAPILSLAAIFVVAGSVAMGLAEMSWMLVGAAVLASGGGLAMMAGLKDEEKTRGKSEVHKGIWYALLASMFISAGHLMAAKVNQELPKGLVTFYAIGLGTAGYLVILACMGRLKELRKMPMREVGIYGTHGLMCFAAGYWLFLISLGKLGVGPAQVISGAWPGLAAVIGVMMYKEKMNWAKAIGTALMTVGAMLAALAH